MFGLKFMVNVACTTNGKDLLIVTVQHGELYLGKGSKPTNFRFETSDIKDTYQKVTKFTIGLFGKNNVHLNDSNYILTVRKYTGKLTPYLLGMNKLSQGKTLDGKLDS